MVLCDDEEEILLKLTIAGISLILLTICRCLETQNLDIYCRKNKIGTVLINHSKSIRKNRNIDNKLHMTSS